MQFTIYISLVLFGFIFTYWACIRYVKLLREGTDSKNIDLFPIGMSIFFGGLALIITYMFPEVRTEDKFKHYRYIICGSVFLVLQIVLTVLLIVYKVITF